MRMRLVLLAGALCVTLTAGDAFGMAWGDSRHRRGNGPTGTGYSESLPEPSSLYALGSALTMLGAAGWMLRRK